MPRDVADEPLATDQPGLAVRDLRARIDRADPIANESYQLRLDLGRALYAQSRHSEAVDELESLLDEPSLSDTHRAAALGVVAGALVLSRRSSAGRAAAEAALASPAADDETRVLALSAIRGLLFFEGRYEAAVDAARAVVEAADHASDIARAEARLDIGGMLFHADDLAGAEAWLTMPDSPPRQRDEADETLATMDLVRGRWRQVLERLGSRPTGDADSSDFSRLLRPALRVVAAVHQDRLEPAHREAALLTHASGLSPAVLVASALLAEADGDSVAMAAHAERAATLTSDPRGRPQLRLWGPELVRLSLAAGDRGSAARLTQALEDATAVTSVASVHGAAQAARGMVEQDPELLASAVERLGVGPRVVARVQASEALAEALRVRGRIPDAIAVLRDVLTSWDGIDAHRDARRVIRTLMELGVRTRPIRKSVDTVGWDALSTTEGTIAALVGEGLTNAQIAERLVISRRTVETHVAHILAKLDVPTRSGIARLAVKHL